MPPEMANLNFVWELPRELLLDLMRDYYAFDGHHYQRDECLLSGLTPLTLSS